MMHRLLDSGLKLNPLTTEQHRFLGLVLPWDKLASMALTDFRRARVVSPQLKNSDSYKNTVRRFKCLVNLDLSSVREGDTDKLLKQINEYILWKNKLVSQLQETQQNLSATASPDNYKTCLKLLGYHALLSANSSETRIMLAKFSAQLLAPLKVGKERARLEADFSIKAALCLHGNCPESSKREIDNKVAKVIKCYEQLANKLISDE